MPYWPVAPKKAKAPKKPKSTKVSKRLTVLLLVTAVKIPAVIALGSLAKAACGLKASRCKSIPILHSASRTREALSVPCLIVCVRTLFQNNKSEQGRTT